jgi:hypothetical protein
MRRHPAAASAPPPAGSDALRWPAMRQLGLLVVALAGCQTLLGIEDPQGGDGPPDADPDRPISFKYVIDSMTIPTTSSEATTFGFDLDGDGGIDNKFGSVMASVASTLTDDLQAPTNDAIARGQILLLAALRTCEDGAVCLSTYNGLNPVPVPCTDPQNLTTCGRHLRGNGSFDVDDATPTNRIDGALDADAFVGGPGTVVVPFPPMLPLETTAISVSLVAAKADLRTVTAAVAAGKLGGGIPTGVIETELIPELHRAIATIIAADCDQATCTCAPKSRGRTLLDLFDADADCVVTLVEVRDNDFIRSVTAPDLDTDGDGVLDALSFGVGVSAAAATFEVP